MELLRILNELEEMIEGCPRLPLSSKVMVDENKLLDYVDRIRTSLPDEIRQAKLLIREREKVLSESKKEAQQLMENVQKQIAKQAEESEIVEMAQQRANEIIQNAERIAEELKFGARDYAEEVLGKIVDSLNATLAQVKAGQEELRKMK